MSIARHLQCGTVCDGAMTIGTSQNHRIVRRNFVEIPSRRKHRRFPVGFDPSSAGYPFAGFCLIDSRLHLCEKVVEARRAFEIESHLAKADAGKMLV